MLKALLAATILVVATACTPVASTDSTIKCECCKQTECCCKGNNSSAKDKPCEKCLKKHGNVKESAPVKK